MPLVQTRGAASAQGFGEFAQATAVNYIEDVFSTYLYTGNSSTQTITNGIDLSTKGGLVWNKLRAGSGLNSQNKLYDTARGVNKEIYSNLTTAQGTKTDALNSFNTTGFTLGAQDINETGGTYASWTFRKQPKFFDIVTYTGTGSNTTIAHSLGAVPGSIIVKRTDTTAAWAVYHRSLANTQYLVLNTTAAAATGATWWNSTTPTSSVFSVGTDATVNASAGTYVAYLFAHDAGGFGLTGTDNVISCGSYTGTGALQTINLGYEAQFVMIKKTSGVDDWYMFDVMRGFVVCPGSGNTPTGDADAALRPNTTAAEQVDTWGIDPAPNGFTVRGNNVSPSGATYIYIAIRRGPMKVPTLGTSVFSPIAAVTGTQTTNFPIDMIMQFWRTNDDIYANTEVVDRLRGVSSNATAQSNYLLTTSTGGTDSLGAINASKAWSNTGFDVPPAYAGGSNIFECFRRAPSFFDEVCYTGDGGYSSYNHNLTVVPEMMIVKARSTTTNWSVYHSALGLGNYVRLNTTAASAGTGDFWYLTPTTTQFSVGGYTEINDTGVTYVNYLFATVAGVSKVGSYTGTGTTQTINCGFTAGSRFVMIKRTDSTGDWYVWDSARGIIAGNDPYLLMNSTAAEVTNTDYVDTANSGFEISSTAPAAINANGGTYIFLAIA